MSKINIMSDKITIIKGVIQNDAFVDYNKSVRFFIKNDTNRLYNVILDHIFYMIYVNKLKKDHNVIVKGTQIQTQGIEIFKAKKIIIIENNLESHICDIY